MDPSVHPAFVPLSRSSHQTSSGSVVASWHTKTDEIDQDAPVLLLMHGWPQTSFLWRHILPALSKRIQVFVADLPGYGFSTPSMKGSDRLTIGTAILEALQAVYGEKARVVLGGHDRGARTVQRLAVSQSLFPKLTFLGAIMIDIVPYAAQWQAAANPRAATSFYHWAFLPVTSLSIPMILAYGGGRYCKDTLLRTVGSSDQGRASLLQDDALEHYASHFEKESVTRAAADDYVAGASVDYDAQIEDQRHGRKINMPACVLYTRDYLGALHDVPAVWKEWISPGAADKFELHAIGEHVGHYIPEEAPEETLAVLTSFLAKLGA